MTPSKVCPVCGMVDCHIPDGNDEESLPCLEGIIINNHRWLAMLDEQIARGGPVPKELGIVRQFIVVEEYLTQAAIADYLRTKTGGFAPEAWETLAPKSNEELEFIYDRAGFNRGRGRSL
jgi:hypothetical protein